MVQVVCDLRVFVADALPQSDSWKQEVTLLTRREEWALPIGGVRVGTSQLSRNAGLPVPSNHIWPPWGD